MKQFISALILLLITPFVYAEKTAYVTDNLSTAVRTGATKENRILYYLPAGTQVTVLDDEVENDFIKVRDERGREGWTLARFITDTKGSIIRLKETQRELNNALQNIEQLKSKHLSEVQNLQERLNSANAIVEASKSYQSLISQLETRNTTLEQQNKRLNDRFEQEVFFAGALVVLGGMFLGFLFGKMGGRKRSQWK